MAMKDDAVRAQESFRSGMAPDNAQARTFSSSFWILLIMSFIIPSLSVKWELRKRSMRWTRE